MFRKRREKRGKKLRLLTQLEGDTRPSSQRQIIIHIVWEYKRALSFRDSELHSTYLGVNFLLLI